MRAALADGARTMASWLSAWVLALAMLHDVPRLLTPGEVREAMLYDELAAANATALHHNSLCDYPRTGMVLTVVAYCPGRDELGQRTRAGD